MICKTEEQRRIWDRVDERIEAERQDGIGAEGVYSEHVHATQRAYIDGLRAGRLAAINALGQSTLTEK